MNSNPSLKAKTCIVICGPTAVGKTGIAIQLAQYLQTSIISADSRQCFRELNIGVAKPSAAELDAIPHYFINSHSITDTVNAAVFEQYALKTADYIFQENSTVIMVGGTGLYINAFCHGMDEIPAIDPTLRKKIIDAFNVKGITWLQQQVRENDPLFISKGEIQNPHRLMRALEVKLATGTSIIEFQQRQKKQRPFNIVKIGLELPREELYNNINTRVDMMMQEGLEEETRSLLPYKTLNALQTVGYRELFDHFDDKIPLDRAVELIKLNSRHYAKRQLTWFKKDETIQWCVPVIEDVMKILS